MTRGNTRGLGTAVKPAEGGGPAEEPSFGAPDGSRDERANPPVTPDPAHPDHGIGGIMARSWDALLEHSFLYPFLALFAALIFFEIFVTLRSGLLVGYDNGEYLFTAFLILHGKSSIFSYEYPLLPAFYTLVILALPNPTAAYAFSDVVTGVILTALFAAGYFLFLRDTASKIGGLAGGAALATIPLFMDEVGWGGQAQLLAFVFGALALHNVLAWARHPDYATGSRSEDQ